MSSFSRMTVAFSLASLAAGILAGATIDSKDFAPDDLFQMAKVRTVEILLSQAEWNAMTPRYAGRGGVSTVPHNDSGVEFNWAHAAFTMDGKKFDDIALRYKGNNTFRVGTLSGKISLKADLNKYVKGQNLATLTKLNLHNNVDDPGWMNEVLAYRLYRDAGVPAPRTSYAKVYVTITGGSEHQYWGLYSIVEEVDSHFAEDRFKAGKGLLLKPVTTSLFEDMGDDWTKYERAYDPKSEPTDAQKHRIIDFCKLVSSAPDDEFAAKLGDYLDVPEFARFMSVMAGLADLDSILDTGKNTYVWLNPETQKFTFIPWDQDHSFGAYPVRMQRNLSIAHPWMGRNRFLERVYAVPAFQTLYKADLAKFREKVFLPERIIAQVNEIAPVIRPAIAEESAAKVKQFDTMAADGNTAGETAKLFVKARAQSVGDQLDGKSTGEAPAGGGMVIIRQQ